MIESFGKWLACTSTTINCTKCQKNIPKGDQLRMAFPAKHYHCEPCSKEVEAAVSKGGTTAPDLLAALKLIADSIQAKPAASQSTAPGATVSLFNKSEADKIKAHLNELDTKCIVLQARVFDLEKQVKDLTGA